MTISGAAFSNTVQGKPVCSNRLVKFCLVRSVVDASMAVQYHLISLGDGEQSRVVELFLTIFSFLFFFFQEQPPEGARCQNNTLFRILGHLPVIDSHSPLYLVVDAPWRVLVVGFLIDPLTAAGEI